MPSSRDKNSCSGGLWVAHACRVLVAVSRHNSLFLNCGSGSVRGHRKVRDPEDALASTRDACAPQIRGYAIFLRKRNAQRMKSKFDIRMRTRRFGQYSKKFAPRKMIARMSAMKYVVGNSAPSA